MLGRHIRCFQSTCMSVLATLLVAGCANLTAIRDFGAISADTATYHNLVTDYVATPTRLKHLEPSEFGPSLDTAQHQRAAQEPLLLLRQTAIAEYMQALAALAADDLVVYDDGVDTLSKALQSGKFASESDAKSFSAITKVVLKATTDGWRQKQLRQLIGDYDPDVQTLISSLRTIVAQGVIANDIPNERGALRNYYETLQRRSHDPAGKAALLEWQAARASELSQREAAATAYISVLDKISAGHRELHEERAALNSKELLRQMKRYAQDLHSLYGAIH